jgi:hypothetical protein
MTGNLDMGGNQVTTLGAPTGNGQALRWEQLTKGADIASASTVAIPNEGAAFDITGTTTITAFSGSYPGRVIALRFTGALTLTNSASLVLPNGKNIATSNGDVYGFCNTAAGVWACVYGPPRLPLMYRSGGTLTFGTNTMTIAPGAWRSVDDMVNIYLLSSMSKVLQTSGSWAPGSGNNGLFNGAATIGTSYHLFVIYNPATRTVDAGYDTSLTAANRPSGYTFYRRVGTIRYSNDAGPIIRKMINVGDQFMFDDAQNILNSVNISTSFQTVNLSTLLPPGVRSEALILNSITGATSAGSLVVKSPELTNGGTVVNRNAVMGFPVGGIWNMPQAVVTNQTPALDYGSTVALSSAYSLAVQGYRDFLED